MESIVCQDNHTDVKTGDNMRGRGRVSISPNYRKLYHQLFNGVTDVIETMKTIQQAAEDTYIEQAGAVDIPEYLDVVK